MYYAGYMISGEITNVWREKRRKAIANEMAQGLEDKLAWPPYLWGIFAPPFVLLREGAICYIVGQFMALALMARASIETAVYLAITTDVYEEPSTKKIDFGYSDERDWSKILAEARKRGYLNKKDVADITFIRTYGNLIAHWGQKVHLNAKDSQVSRINSQKEINVEPFTFQSTLPSMSLTKFFITEVKATIILRKSIRVLKSLADKI